MGTGRQVQYRAGTPLANLLAAKGETVRLWAYEPEVVEAIVERHGQAGAGMQPYLQADQIASGVRVELCDLRPHVQRRSQRVEWIDEASHHSVANRLHEGTRVARDAFPQIAEVQPHEVERLQVADPLVQRDRWIELCHRTKQ